MTCATERRRTGRAPGQGTGLAGYGNGDLLGEPGRLDVYVARAFVAYDIPQNAHGYSRGVLGRLRDAVLAARAASFQLPTGPGGALSWDVAKERADALEVTWSPRFL